jgi:hypothetical protein
MSREEQRKQRRERAKRAEEAKSVSASVAQPRETGTHNPKPIDRWLGIGGIVATIFLFLLAKTPFIVVVLLVAIFGLLCHPIWHFWWIEKSLPRRFGSLLVLGIVLLCVGRISWPTVPAQNVPSTLTPKPQPALTEKQVEDALRRAMPSSGLSTPPNLTAATAFSVAIEVKFITFGNHTIGFWIQHLSDIYASSLALFVRITNLQDIPVMISRYDVDVCGDPNGDSKCTVERLDTTTGRVFYTPPKGSPPPNTTGGIIHFPADNTGTYILRHNPEDADMDHAIMLSIERMDYILGSAYIEAHHTVRGWTFFQGRYLFPDHVVIRLTDVVGHTYSYVVRSSNAKVTGDIMKREMIIQDFTDLSNSIRHMAL